MGVDGVRVIVLMHVALGGTIRPPKAKVPPLPSSALLILCLWQKLQVMLAVSKMSYRRKPTKPTLFPLSTSFDSFWS